MMIPDPQFCVLCDDVRQEASGRFIFLGIIGDGILVKQFPVKVQKLVLVTRWTAGQGEFKQQSVLMAPDSHSEIIRGQQMDVKLADGSRTHTNIEQFMGIEFKEPGTYWWEVSLDNNLRVRFPLTVRPAPQHTAQ